MKIGKEKRNGKRVFAVLLAALMLCMTPASAFGIEWDIANGDIIIGASTNPENQTVKQGAAEPVTDSAPIITGTSSTNTISVITPTTTDGGVMADAPANFTIENLNISAPEGKSAIDVGSSSASIKVNGNNTVSATGGNAAIHVTNGALHVNGEGTLNAKAEDGAGIGSNKSKDFNGSLHIGDQDDDKVTINAYSNSKDNAVGAGSGGKVLSENWRNVFSDSTLNCYANPKTPPSNPGGTTPARPISTNTIKGLASTDDVMRSIEKMREEILNFRNSNNMNVFSNAEVSTGQIVLTLADDTNQQIELNTFTLPANISGNTYSQLTPGGESKVAFVSANGTGLLLNSDPNTTTIMSASKSDLAALKKNGVYTGEGFGVMKNAGKLPQKFDKANIRKALEESLSRDIHFFKRSETLIQTTDGLINRSEQATSAGAKIDFSDTKFNSYAGKSANQLANQFMTCLETEDFSDYKKSKSKFGVEFGLGARVRLSENVFLGVRNMYGPSPVSEFEKKSITLFKNEDYTELLTEVANNRQLLTGEFEHKFTYKQKKVISRLIDELANTTDDPDAAKAKFRAHIVKLGIGYRF
ncbi:MAG: hypothetical protein Q4C25_09065, partial [Bacillota bacterium]|nr:hypothetical protein [Bacillota bacterium]